MHRKRLDAQSRGRKVWFAQPKRAMPRVRKSRQMDITRDEILEKLEENGEAIRAFGVRRLGIFGSYARGEQKRASDIDFLVDFDDATLQKLLEPEGLP